MEKTKEEDEWAWESNPKKRKVKEMRGGVGLGVTTRVQTTAATPHCLFLMVTWSLEHGHFVVDVESLACLFLSLAFLLFFFFCIPFI